jgi:hypothetical protein
VLAWWLDRDPMVTAQQGDPIKKRGGDVSGETVDLPLPALGPVGRKVGKLLVQLGPLVGA